MKVLFVCRGNAGRSQIAGAFFERFSKKHKAVSAGTHVEPLGKVGLPPNKMVTQVMQEIGYDLSTKRRKQLTEDMIKDADMVIVLMPRAERGELLPAYVGRSSKKISFWDVEDLRGKGEELYGPNIKNREKIMKLVRKLVDEIESD